MRLVSSSAYVPSPPLCEDGSVTPVPRSDRRLSCLDSFVGDRDDQGSCVYGLLPFPEIDSGVIHGPRNTVDMHELERLEQ